MRLPGPLTALLLLAAACIEPQPAQDSPAPGAGPAPSGRQGPGQGPATQAPPGGPQHGGPGGPRGPGGRGAPDSTPHFMGPGGLPPFDPQAPTPTYEGTEDPEPSFPAATPDADGMVVIAAGWVELGPHHVNSVPGVPAELLRPGPPEGAPESMQHGQPDADPSARAHPDATMRPGPAPQAHPSSDPWTSTGGQQLPPRRVRVDAFRIDRTEVTRAAYKEFLDATGYRPPHVDEPWADDMGFNWHGTDFPEGTGDHPVVLTSWYDATEYCAWRGKRLPTEAEWQLAALGPVDEGRIFPWGTVYGEKRFNHGRMEEPNFDPIDGYLTTSPVGSFPGGRSPDGLEDMFGNAWEFTSDRRVDTWQLYEGERVEGGWANLHSSGPGLYMAVRGGSYFFDARPNPGGERNHFIPELRRKTSGFRCAADAR